MKVEVIKNGIRDAKGKKLQVGDTVDVKGEKVPAYMVNKVRELSDRRRKVEKAEDDGKSAITNPAQTGAPVPPKPAE